MTGVRGDGTTQAVSAFLLDRAHLLLPLAAQLGADTARLRERHPRQQHGAGDSRRRAHPGATRRSSALPGRRRRVLPGRRWLHGPSRRVPDAPSVRRGLSAHRGRCPLCPRPAGAVRARCSAPWWRSQINGQWQPVGPQTPGPWHRRVVRAMTLPAMIAAMWLSVAAASAAWPAAARSTVEIGGAPSSRRRRQPPAACSGALASRRHWRSAACGELLDRIRHPGVTYRKLDVARINALFPRARRLEVAGAISDSLAASDNHVYFRNVSWYNWCHRHLPRGIPALDDLYPPNLAVLDFLAHRIAPSRARGVARLSRAASARCSSTRAIWA